jgi:hypothetical protein
MVPVKFKYCFGDKSPRTFFVMDLYSFGSGPPDAVYRTRGQYATVMA